MPQSLKQNSYFSGHNHVSLLSADGHLSLRGQYLHTKTNFTMHPDI